METFTPPGGMGRVFKVAAVLVSDLQRLRECLEVSDFRTFTGEITIKAGRAMELLPSVQIFLPGSALVRAFAISTRPASLIPPTPASLGAEPHGRSIAAQKSAFSA